MPLLVLLLPVVLGCEPSASPTDRRSSSSLDRRSDRSEVLFSAVVQQLRNLASYVDTELQPPVVILDSTQSSNGQDVLATFSAHPENPDGPNNIVIVPENNSRFRALGVRPGDIVKYTYTRYDQQNMETDLGETVTLDLTVAQVLSENTLLVEGGLNQPMPVPQKIEIWRYTDQRLNAITRQLANYLRYRQPVFDWEPSGDARALKQITERLNQWMRQSPPPFDWSPPTLLSTLDRELASDERLAPLLSPESLSAEAFEPYEGRLLQEAVWHRDISRWAQGDSFDDVARATALFDWTVQNVQLDEDSQALPNRPWQSLLYGHGTAEQRAWIFALLARQQGLNVAVLTLPASDRPDSTAGETKGDDASDNENETAADPAASHSQFWTVALLSDGALYLFDPWLGLPIPGPEGQGVATLAEVQADPALLRQLDLDEAPYPVTEAQLRHVTANVVADPFDLSKRAAAVESKLTGDDRLALTSQAAEIAQQLQPLPAISEVRLWEVPFRTWRDQLWIPIAARQQWVEAFQPFAWRPTLWKARMLHFQGHGPVGGPPENSAQQPVADDHAEAIRDYTSRSVRPPERIIVGLGSEAKQDIYRQAKANASYWVGLLLFDQGEFRSAENWLHHPKLSAGNDEFWGDGTRYNLARTYEALGQLDEAIELLEDDDSPQRHGNRLRAGRLKSQRSDDHAEDDADSP